MMSPDEIREHYGDKGYVVLRGAFPRAHIVELGRRMEAELERLAAIAARLPEDMRKNIERSEMPAHDTEATFRLDPANYSHLTESAALRTALTRILGEPYVWHYPTMFRKIAPGNSAGFLPFHQDYSYNSRYPRLVTCWIPLNDCGTDSPSLSVVARKMDVRLEHTSNGKWESGVADEEIARAVPDAPVVDIECAAGDLVLFGELTLHRTNYKSGMTRPRMSMDTRAIPLSSIDADVRRQRRFVAADRPELVRLAA